jgi:hypothetical protein
VIAARRFGFEANNAYSKAWKYARLSRHRISFVALCVEMDTDQERGHAGEGWIRVPRSPSSCFIFEAQTVADQKLRTQGDHQRVPHWRASI